MIFFIICFIYYPISFFTILLVFLLYFFLLLLLCGIGIVMGVFAISNENIWALLRFSMGWFFWFSCMTYPFQIFPPFIQVIINLNPFYHIFNILRVAWVTNDVLSVINSYFVEFLIFLIPSIVLPIIGIFVFNKVYEKYGIVGY